MENLINIYILLLLVVCMYISSCSDWLDVNNNPNTAEKVEAGYLFQLCCCSTYNSVIVLR